MKNFWFALGAVLLISSCSDKKEEQTQVSELSTEQALEAGEQIVAKPQFDIKFEEITYHYDAANLPGKCDKGSEVVLTSKEFALLRLMLENQGKVFTRQMLLDRLWDDDAFVEDRIVDSHIKNIRKKLDADYIETIRGVGYRIDKEH